MPVFFFSQYCVWKNVVHIFMHVHMCVTACPFLCICVHSGQKLMVYILLSLSPPGALKQCHSLKPLFRLVYEPTSSCCVEWIPCHCIPRAGIKIGLLAYLTSNMDPVVLNSESKNCAGSIFTYYCTYPAPQLTILKWKLGLNYFESC